VPLCDYFVASAADVEKMRRTGKLPDSLERIDAKHFDSIPLDKLGAKLGAGKSVEPEPVIPPDGYEWVAERLTGKMVDALAALSDAHVKKHDPVVGELRRLAQIAKKKKHGLYVWLLP
jgi:hypothetical protein